MSKFGTLDGLLVLLCKLQLQWAAAQGITLVLTDEEKSLLGLLTESE